MSNFDLGKQVRPKEVKRQKEKRKEKKKLGQIVFFLPDFFLPRQKTIETIAGTRSGKVMDEQKKKQRKLL